MTTIKTSPADKAPAPSSVVVDTSRSPYSQLRPIPVSNVRFDKDGFWGKRQEINRTVTLQQQWEQLWESGRIRNFQAAAGTAEAPIEGFAFNDTDVYKWLEAASWSLIDAPDDKELISKIDQAIDIVAAAQLPDGYLDTFYRGEKKEKRWTSIHDHEMYNAGHLIQAALAHYRVTGGKKLLNIAILFADNICATFGPEGSGKKNQIDGHEEIEMALIELYRATGDEKYLNQSTYFINARGYGLLTDPTGWSLKEYAQDHLPFRESTEIVGHAVRAVYMECGGADLYAETGESALLSSMETRWNSMTKRKMYVTGGIGASSDGERFGRDYDLPSLTAYAETCAAIGNVMWNWRMLQLTGQAKYADLMELALYNGVLSGISTDGRVYFYDNPLTSDGHHKRTPWFPCACCPPNVARLIASLPGYAASQSDHGVWLHLYESGEIDAALANGRRIKLKVETRYPWDGEVLITVLEAPPTEVAVNLRIPGWAKGAEYSVNGATSLAAAQSYAVVSRRWSDGDVIALSLPLEARKLAALPLVADAAGRIAVIRGPIVYAIEQVDNPDAPIPAIRLPLNSRFETDWRPDELGGIVALTTDGIVIDKSEWGSALYKEIESQIASKPVRITAIPYYAWANREPGAMTIWIPSV